MWMGHRHPWARTLSSETVLHAGSPNQLFPSPGCTPYPQGSRSPVTPSAQCGTCPWRAGGGPPPNGAPWSSDSGSRAPHPAEALFSKGMVQNQAPAPRAGLTPHLSSPVSVVGSVGSHLDGLEYLDYLHLLGRGALSKVSEVVGNSCKWRGLGLSQGHWACLLVYCPFPSWRQQLGLFMVVSPAP